jgi:hypothetical protein
MVRVDIREPLETMGAKFVGVYPSCMARKSYAQKLWMKAKAAYPG